VHQLMFTGRRLSGFGSGHATPRSSRQERGRSLQQQQHRELCDPVAPCGLQLPNLHGVVQ
jgi:hypothetical protein